MSVWFHFPSFQLFPKTHTSEPTTMSNNSEYNNSDTESEPELEGANCAGASYPRIVITYTMAGGGAHWENWEVHYDIESGDQKELYINNINGHHYEYGMKLFYHEDEPDQLRIEATDFEQEDWQEMVHYN